MRLGYYSYTVEKEKALFCSLKVDIFDKLRVEANWFLLQGFARHSQPLHFKFAS